MAAATVLYVLNQGGNLNQQLPQTTAKLEALRAKAVQTTAAVKGVGSSIPLPSFERFSAVLGTAVVGTAALMTHAVGVEKQMRAMGIDTGKAAAALGGYEQATNRLTAALQQLELTAATAMSGDLGRFVDMLTGAAIAVETLIDRFGGMATGLRDIGSAAVEMMSKMGPALGPLGALAGLATGTGSFASFLANLGAGQGTPYNGPIYGPEWPGPGYSGGGGGGGGRTAPAGFQSRVGPISGVSGLPGLTDPAAIAWFDRLTTSLRDTVTAMGPLAPALDQFSAAVDEGFRRVQRAAGLEGAASAIGAFGSGDLGTVVSSTAAAAGAGPIGMLLAAIIGTGPKLDELNKTLKQQLMKFVPQTVDALVNMMSVNARSIAKQIPELANQIGEAIPELIFALAANLPGIIAASLSALVTAPVALVKGFADGIVQASAVFPDMLLQSWLRAWRAIKTEFRELFGLGDGTASSRARTSFSQPHNRFDPVNPNYMARGRGGGHIYNVNVNARETDVRRLSEELRRGLGTHGYGLTLAPLVP